MQDEHRRRVDRPARCVFARGRPRTRQARHRDHSGDEYLALDLEAGRSHETAPKAARSGSIHSPLAEAMPASR